MPNDDMVSRSLKQRYERSLADWVDRLKLWGPYSTPTYGDFALVRIDPPVDVDAQTQRVVVARLDNGRHDDLGVYVTRYLGENEYLVKLLIDEDRNQLAIKGWLSVRRHGYLITAL